MPQGAIGQSTSPANHTAILQGDSSKIIDCAPIIGMVASEVAIISCDNTATRIIKPPTEIAGSVTAHDSIILQIDCAAFIIDTPALITGGIGVHITVVDSQGSGRIVD